MSCGKAWTDRESKFVKQGEFMILYLTIYAVAVTLFLIGWTSFLRSYRRQVPQKHDLFTIAGRAAWHREQMEMLAEQAVEIAGYAADPESLQAEMAREIVYCSRAPLDAVLRINEIESLITETQTQSEKGNE